jgi:hypothetical protein
MKTFSFSVLTILLLFFANCCKDEPPVQKDPCDEIRSKKGDFIIVQKNDGVYYILSKDTINYENGLNLKAIGFKYISVQWVIGNDPKRYTGDSLSLYLKQPYNSIKVIMYGWRAKESCIPGDDGADTVVHTVVALPDTLLNMYGVFRGVSNYFPKDTFNVSIKRFYDHNFKWVNVFDNFPNSCSPFKNNPYSYAKSLVIVFQNGLIVSASGWLLYDSILKTNWQYERFHSSGWKRKDGLYEFTVATFLHKDSVYHFVGRKIK